MDYYKFGNKICSLREKAGLTQKELAQKLNVSDKAISKWENGRSIPRIETLEEMSKLFGVSTNELLFDDKKSDNFNLEEYRLRMKGAQYALKSEKIKKLFIYVFLSFIALFAIEFALMLIGYGFSGNSGFIRIIEASVMGLDFFPVVFTAICIIRTFGHDIIKGLKELVSRPDKNIISENTACLAGTLINKISVILSVFPLIIAVKSFDTVEYIIPRVILISVNILLLAVHCFTDKYFDTSVILTEKGFFDESVEYGQFHSFDGITDFSSNAGKTRFGILGKYKVRFVSDGKKYRLSFWAKDNETAMRLFNDTASICYSEKSGLFRLFLIPAVLGYIILIFGFIMFVGTMRKPDYQGYKQRLEKPSPLSGITSVFADNGRIYAFVENSVTLNVFDEKSGKFLFAVKGISETNGQSYFYIKNNEITVYSHDGSLCRFSENGDFIARAAYNYIDEETPVASVFDRNDKILFSVSLPSDFSNLLVDFTEKSVDYLAYKDDGNYLCTIDTDENITLKSVDSDYYNIGKYVDGAVYREYDSYDDIYSISRGRLIKRENGEKTVIYKTPFFEWYKNSINACWLTGAFGMLVSAISFILSKRRKKVRI